MLGMKTSRTLACALAFNCLAAVHATGIGVACSEYDTSQSVYSLTITNHPEFVEVDTAEWVYYAADTESAVVRSKTDGSTTQTITGTFGSIGGICLSPADQTLYVVDREEGVLYGYTCISSLPAPSDAREAMYCGTYATYNFSVPVTMTNPTQCAVDPAGNVYVSEELQMRVFNMTSYSSSTITTGSSTTLGPVAIDPDALDVYVGAATKILRLPCTEVDAAGTACLQFGTPTNPNTSPVTLRNVIGMELNHGEGDGDFSLILADSVTAEVIQVTHPKGTTGSGSVLASLGAANIPGDLALNPITYDVVVAEPVYTGTTGQIARLPCITEVFAPTPAPPTTTGPGGSGTTTQTPTTDVTSGGTIFCIIFFVLVIIYFGGGALFLRFVRNECSIPNPDVWRGLLGLVQDGATFVFCCGRKPGGHVPYDGGRAAPSKATTGGGDAPKYGNYDAMSDDL